MTKKEMRMVLLDISPVIVQDGGLFESEILAKANEGGAQIILFQGEKRIAECYRLSHKS